MCKLLVSDVKGNHVHFLSIVYTKSTSPDASVEVNDLFKEPITITEAYTTLHKQLGEILKYYDVITLKGALISQADTPHGVELGKEIETRIDRAKSTSKLLYALNISHCCNWLDIRLIELLAYSSESLRAVELIKAYKKQLFPRKLVDVLSKQSQHKEAKKEYIDAVCAKTKMDASKITVEDFITYRWTIEDVILDLGKRKLNIEHVREGCLEIHYHILTKCSFDAYKMAIHNRYKFHGINLIHIKIGDHPLIYDPWLSDLDKQFVKEITNSLQKG